MNSNDGENCLICSCSSKDAPLQNLSGFATATNDNLSCNNQLQVILLLRKVLHLRKGFLESILKSTGQNPSAWNLKLCGVCHRIFEEASFVSSRLNKLNEEFEELSLALRTKAVRNSGLENQSSTTVGQTEPLSRRRRGIKRKVGRPRKSIKNECNSSVLQGGDLGLEGGTTTLPVKIRREVINSLNGLINNINSSKETFSKIEQTGIPAEPTKYVEMPILVKQDLHPAYDADVWSESSFHEDDVFQSHDDEAPDIALPNDSINQTGVYADAIDEAVEDDDPIDPSYSPDIASDQDQSMDELSENDVVDEDDDDYKPAPAVKKRSRKRVKQNDGGRVVLLKAIKMENENSYQCSKCQQVFETSAQCNEHIFKDHYGGNWQQDFSCHICNAKFRTEFWLREHMKMRHPENPNLVTDEVLEQCIQNGTVTELTYKVVPVGQKRTQSEDFDSSLTPKTNPSKFLRSDEPPPDAFSIPHLQPLKGNIKYIVLPNAFLKLPQDILALMKRGDEEKLCPRPHCTKAFPTELQLRGHIEYVHEGQSNCYACPMCPKKFERIGKLLGHMQQIHVQQLRHFCERCGKLYPEDILLQAHIQKQHFGIDFPYKCIVCKARHSKRNDLNKHLKRTHKLQIVSDVFRKPKRMSAGAKKSSKSYPRPKISKRKRDKTIPCPKCEEENQITNLFATEEELDIHVKRVHLGVSRPYPCSICKRKYSTPAHLQVHMKMTHTVRSDLEVRDEEVPLKVEPPPLFSCSDCNKFFKSKYLLESHLLGVAHKNHRPFVCEICSLTFRTMTSLTRHQSQIHYEELNISPFKCTYCEKVLNSQTNLDNHINVVHTKTSKFKCPHCGSGSHSQAALINHINIRHTKRNVFLCPQCPKTFLSNMYLKFHHARVHSGLKPYECQICSKKFADKPTYNRHVEAHSNVIHDCPHCGKSGFKTRHALRVHVRTAHGDLAGVK